VAISGETATGGAGGGLAIGATTHLLVSDNATISASSSGAGASGGIAVIARRATVERGGSIAASAAGAGNAGAINVDVNGAFNLASGGFIDSRAAQVDAGSIRIAAGTIDVTDDRPGQTPPTQIADSERARGAGPTNTRITAESTLGGGGNITLVASERVYVRDSLITASAAIQSTGGGTTAQIKIDPPTVTLASSLIDGSVQAAQDPDVPVIIEAAAFIKSPDSEIRSDAAVVPVEVDIAGSLTRLPGSLGDDAARLAEQCGLQIGGNTSSVISGGTPLAPEGFGADFAVVQPRQRRELQ
jgi:hypothetical protein